MKTNKTKKKTSILRDPFSYIAFWQFLTFIMLLLLVWVNELRDISALMFGSERGDTNILRGCVLSAFVLLTAIIVIGNTYVHQRKVLNSLISLCAKCHRVRLNQDNWQVLEEYVGNHSSLTFTHGLCPKCLKETMDAIDERNKTKLEEQQDAAEDE